jgi:uncharacterized protein
MCAGFFCLHDGIEKSFFRRKSDIAKTRKREAYYMANVISWFDVPTVDFNRAVKFYSEILGKPVRVAEYMGQTLGFFPMDGDGVGGNLAPPHDNFQPSTQGTRVYLNCEGQLDEVLSRVEKAGGKIVAPKMSIGEPGWIAFILDTEGNSIGMHSRS